MTFSYTFAWYSWQDWEKLLDWAAWRGINLQLAWVGYEKIFLDSFKELGLTEDEILAFFSGPAFQAWNRFGNIQGSWGGEGNLTLSWIESQFAMQKKIVARMSELGITPILPAFPGFVPRAITRVRPNASVTAAPNWLTVADFSEDLFLSPLDPTSQELQKLFISKQIDAFGNITNIYTLDQFNEMQPTSSDIGYITNVSTATYTALTEANPAAIWLMQGWFFYNNPDYWTQQRIDAYLDGIGEPSNTIILDLYADNYPQWERTQSFSGRPWIWCELHSFGGNMNLFGQASKIATEPIAALKSSKNLIGFGLTPEGYEGNEVVYDLLLDQAWSADPIDLKAYFKEWTTLRYGQVANLPGSLYQAWDILREYVYDVTDPGVPCTGVGVYQIQPALTGLTNRTGHWPAPTAIGYDPNHLKTVLGLMLQAAVSTRALWEVPAFQLDIVDVTRQVMTNAFIDVYDDLVMAFNASFTANSTALSRSKFQTQGKTLLGMLDALDLVLSTNEHFTLAKWLGDARNWAKTTQDDGLIAFNARSQVTVWDWDAPFLNDYSARAWSGLASTYYKKRWQIFINGLQKALETKILNQPALQLEIHAFEKTWQYTGFQQSEAAVHASASVQSVIANVTKQWPDLMRT